MIKGMLAATEAAPGVSEFQRSDFTKEMFIGEGADGQVYEVEHELTGSMAVKIFARARTGLDREKLREIENIAKCTHHPNIIRFFGYVVEYFNGSRIITGYAMENMANGSLDKVIHDANISYDSLEVAKWGRQAALALAWLHSQEIIHRDVKPHNMLLSDNRRLLKLCDFGRMRAGGEFSMTLGVGTLLYMSPELRVPIDFGRYSGKCDVYSMGITLWEMAVRKVPFCTVPSNRPPLDMVPVAPLRDIIRPCYSEDPDLRPTMKELADNLKHFVEESLKAAVQSNEHTVDTFVGTTCPPPRTEIDDLSRTLTSMNVTEPHQHNIRTLTKIDDKVKNTLSQVRTLYNGTNGSYIIAVKNVNDKSMANGEGKPEQRPENHPQSEETPPAIPNDIIILEKINNSMLTVIRRFTVPVDYHGNLIINPKREIVAYGCKSNGAKTRNFRVFNFSGIGEGTLASEQIIQRTQTMSVSSLCYFAWSGSGEKLFAICGPYLSIWKYNGEFERELTFPETTDIQDAVFNVNDRCIIITTRSFYRERSIIVWDYIKGQQVHKFFPKENSEVYGWEVAWLNEDTFVVLDDLINIFRVGTDKPIKTDGKYQYLKHMSIDCVYEMIAAIDNEGNNLRVYSLASDKLVYQCETKQGKMSSLQWSPKGIILACYFYESATCAKYVQLRDVFEKFLLRSIVMDGSYQMYTFSPDGSCIVTGGGNKSELVSIWNVQTGELLKQIRHHEGEHILCRFKWQGYKLFVYFGMGTSNIYMIDFVSTEASNASRKAFEV